MQISHWLTDIAQSFNPKIEYVSFESLKAMRAAVCRDPNKIESYHIVIDKDQMICPFQVLHAFYHELGHIERFDLGYMRHKRSKADQEAGADWFAFNHLGMIDKYGQVKKEYRACYDCMKNRSKMCLKEGGQSPQGPGGQFDVRVQAHKL